MPAVQLSMAEIIEEEQVLENVIINIVNEPHTNSPYLNIENTKIAFALFAENLSASVKSLIKILEPEIIEQTIIIKLAPQQLIMVDKIKAEWQAYLRNYFSLQNLFLKIDESDEEIIIKKAYSAKEKLDEMVLENPDLKLLINKLNLKIK